MPQLNIPLQPITSTQISGVGYDKASQTLAVRFAKGGAVYHYAGVSPGIFEGLLTAKSPGQYMRANVLNRFNFTRQQEGDSNADSDQAGR